MLGNVASNLTLCAARVHYSTTTRLATVHVFLNPHDYEWELVKKSLPRRISKVCDMIVSC